MLRGALSHEEASSTLTAARAAHFPVAAYLHGVPIPQLNLISDGEWKLEAAAFRTLLEEPFKRLRRHVLSLSCAKGIALDVSRAYICRYLPGEVRNLSFHYDYESMVTALCSLTPAQSDSGLYIQPDPDDPKTAVFPPLKTGDFVVHGWDTPHGVTVNGEEERFSLVVWFKPKEDVASGRNDWFHQYAIEGSLHAQYVRGEQIATRGDVDTGLRLLQGPSKRGHWPSTCKMAELLIDRGDAEEAQMLLRAVGSPAAVNQLAKLAVRLGEHAEARRLLLEAATLGDEAAMDNLAMFLDRGIGGPVDAEGAAAWRKRFEDVVRGAGSA